MQEPGTSTAPTDEEWIPWRLRSYPLSPPKQWAGCANIPATSMAENGNGSMPVFRWVLGIAQAVIVALTIALLNGQNTMSSGIATLNTRVSALEPVANAYAGLANRVTALETIANENSRRMTDNTRKIEQIEMLLDRKLEQIEKRFREAERREGSTTR